MTVSDELKMAVNAPELDDEFIILVTLTHSSLSIPIRICSHDEDIVSQGETFIACPFEITLPLDDPEQPLRAQARIDNVDRRISESLERAQEVSREFIEVKFDLILESDPDTLEIEHDDFILKDVKVNSLDITGTLTLEDYSVEPYPAPVYTPGTFPGGF